MEDDVLCEAFHQHFNKETYHLADPNTTNYIQNGLPSYNDNSLENTTLAQNGVSYIYDLSDDLYGGSGYDLHDMTPSHERNVFLENIRFYINVVVTPVFCTFGIGGNILNVVVLTRRRMQAAMDCGMEKAAYIGLIALAVSDMLYCITALPDAFKGPDNVIYDHRSFRMYYEMYGKYLQNTFSYCSTWLTLIMAASRYAAICHPLHAREFIRTGCTIIGIVSTLVLWILLNLPYIWTYEVSTTVCPGPDGVTVYYMLDTGLFNSNPVFKTTFTYIWTFAGFLLPVALLSYCNFHLIRALRESMRMRQEYRVSARPQQTGNKITPTLIAIVAMFIILVTPSEVINFTYFCIRGSNTDAALTLIAVFNAMHTLNFAINFVLYCVVNVHFRSTLKDLLFCCREKKSRGNMLNRHSLSNFTTKTYAPYSHSITESML